MTRFISCSIESTNPLPEQTRFAHRAVCPLGFYTRLVLTSVQLFRYDRKLTSCALGDPGHRIE
jgi:hypothetical protein